MSEGNVSRRGLLMAAGVITGGAFGLGRLLGQDGMAQTLEAPRTLRLPWTLGSYRFDPVAIRQSAYENFYEGECMFAVAATLVRALQADIGAPFLIGYYYVIEPVYGEYNITMDFEYWAGEPPVITGGEREKENSIVIGLDQNYINPTSGGTLTLSVKIFNAQGQLIPNQPFTLKIYPSNNTTNFTEEQRLGGHAHAVDGGEGRPLVKFKPEPGQVADRINNTLKDEYYRIIYEAEKGTGNTGIYTANFVPHSTAPRRGIIPYGGVISFEVECNGIKKITDLEVKVPNLAKLSPPEAFPPYKLEGGTHEHPGPTLYSDKNWNHYGTVKGKTFLDKMGREFYFNVAKTKNRICYNDMLLIYGGNFDAIGTLWKILPSGHKEHTGHSNFGETNCDMRLDNLSDSDKTWIEDHVKLKTKDQITIEPNSHREIIHKEPERNHWHFRLFESLIKEDEEEK